MRARKSKQVPDESVQSTFAIEKVDQANDGDILSLARKYFKVPTAMVHTSYIAGL
jgi:hypothetical protein